MKNHLGSFECKLCLTLHTTEGNYLAHTQGKRHQQNLARRAAREEQVCVYVPFLFYRHPLLYKCSLLYYSLSPFVSWV